MRTSACSMTLKADSVFIPSGMMRQSSSSARLGGRNRGRVGVIKNREKHKGSFHVQDATGHEFATCMGNVFTIGKGTKPWISLPKGKGIKLGSNSVNIHVPIDCSPKGMLVEMNTQCAHADNGCGSCSCEDNAMNEPILNSKLEAVTYV
ncbi:hypothetical protein JHK87_047642 [Glycine soja]|nr:hypothetical protein JHK87_047642 [Glycine soja]